MYLMIQNRGVAPTEAFTILGASTSRDDDTPGVIGQFGTGANHAVNVLLRAGLNVRVYCGKTRLEFFTREDIMSDDLGSKTVQRVCVKYGGTSTRTEDLGWVLDFGSIDWDDIGMAIREFVSNALDRTIRGGQDIAEARECGDLTVIPVETRKAKDGYTRVYVEINDAVLRYYGELPKRFLHFSDHPEQANMRLLPKADRNLTDCQTAMIYREGVLVTELKETKMPSLYDYNFAAGQVSIDDCRKSNEYSLRAACAARLRQATADELTPVFKALQSGEKCFEADLDPYYLLPSWSSATEKQTKEWKTAWEATAGEKVLADADAPAAVTLAARKGHKAAKMPTNWANVAGRMGITTVAQVLTDDERKGRERLPATEAAIKALDMVWGWVEMAEMTQSKPKPEIGCFRDITDAECDCMGFYPPGEKIVYVREDIASGFNKYLLKTTLEEVTHYVTGSTDLSRDFQNFAFDMIVEYLAA